MRRTRLTTTLVAIPLLAVACGTATSPTTGSGPTSPAGTTTTTTTEGSGTTAEAYAARLLATLNVPSGATVSGQSPSKAFDHLPGAPSLSRTPVVVKKFWTVDESASSVIAWLRQHGTDTSLQASGSGGVSATGPAGGAARYLMFRAASLPAGIAVGDVSVAVVQTGPSTSAIAAYAVTLAQPARPAAERIPLDLSKATIGWSIAPGGTPALKILTGSAASALAKDFDALQVNTAGDVMCPLIMAGSQITVIFAGGGHTWHVVVPACPGISVTRDGRSLPELSFGPAFMADLKHYVGHLPQVGPISSSGGATPLVVPPKGH